MAAQAHSQASNRRHLRNSPLIRVLCQIRWHDFTTFELSEVLDGLSQGIGVRYPIQATQEQDWGVLAPGEIERNTSYEIHSLASADLQWRVSLGKQFVTLESHQYPGHKDFIGRLVEVIDTIVAVTEIPSWHRIGYRYTNRITDTDDIDHLESYFKDVSVLGGIMSLQLKHKLQRTVSESIYKDDDDTTLTVRSALLAPNSLIDPTLVPVAMPSWVLDIDAFQDKLVTTPLSGEIAKAKAEALAGKAHDHFRSLISEQFLERFG